MNLAIEYLVRTGAIKGFFQAPQSLFLEDGDRRLVVAIEEESHHPESYHVVHWDMSQLKNNLPQQRHFFVPKAEVFSHRHTAIPHYTLLPYEEESIDTDHNDYNHPMRSEIFEHFTKHFLNSRAHQRTRTIWLWCSFTERFFNRSFDVWRRAEIDVSFERHVVQHDYPTLWTVWCRWKDLMLLESSVAAELLFMPVYQVRQQQLFTWDLPF